MLRGNGGQDIFFSPEDRYRLFLLIQGGLERFRHRVHAFCLMNNHIHLAVQVSDISLSRIVQNLSFRYTRWVNSQQKRMGHLFQGRHKAVLVGRDNYLLELVRYIHLNPVRTGLVMRAEDYAFDIGEADMCGASRKRSFSEARGVAAWAVSEAGQHTLADS